MARRVHALPDRRRVVVAAAPSVSHPEVAARGVLSIRSDGGSRARLALAQQVSAGNQAVVQAVARAHEVEGHGECTAGPPLECSAKASRESQKALKIPVPTRKRDKAGNVTYKATGKATGTFTSTVSIDLASVPDGLSTCAAKKIKALIDGPLKNHELNHKRRFLTTDPKHAYNGTWKKAVTETGDDPDTVQSTIAARLESAFDEEAASRQQRNDDHAITAIDPFSVTADISKCPECASGE
jgi:hypothetical protein